MKFKVKSVTIYETIVPARRRKSMMELETVAKVYMTACSNGELSNPPDEVTIVVPATQANAMMPGTMVTVDFKPNETAS
jgi:hypothetical protein